MEHNFLKKQSRLELNLLTHLELNLFPKICSSLSKLKIKSTKYEFNTLKKFYIPKLKFGGFYCSNHTIICSEKFS